MSFPISSTKAKRSETRRTFHHVGTQSFQIRHKLVFFLHKKNIKNSQELEVEEVIGDNVKFSRNRVLHTSEIMIMLVDTRRLDCQI